MRCCRCEKHTQPNNDGDCNRDSSSRISSEEECTVFHQWKINKQLHIDEQDCSSGDFENPINPPACIRRHIFQNCKFSNPNSHNVALEKKERNQISYEDPGKTELIPYTTILDDQNKCIPSTSHYIFHSPIHTYNSSSYSSINSSCVNLRNNKITCLSNEENISTACKHHWLSNWNYLDTSKHCDDDYKTNNINDKYNQNFDVYNITVAPMDTKNSNRTSQNTQTHMAQRREDNLKNSKSDYQAVSQNESQNSTKADKEKNKYLFRSERLKRKHQTNLEEKDSDISSSSTESGELYNFGKRKHRPLTSKGTGSYYPEKRTLKKKSVRSKYKLIKPIKKLKVKKEPSYNYLENCNRNKCHVSCRTNQHTNSPNINPGLNKSYTLISSKQNLSSSSIHHLRHCHCHHSHKCKQMNSTNCNESIDQCNRFENEESNYQNNSQYCNHKCNCNKLRNKMDSFEIKTKKDIANGNIKMTDSGNKIVADVNDVRTNDTETNTSNLKNTVNQSKITTKAVVEDICDDSSCSLKKVSRCNRLKLSGDGKFSMHRHITDVVVLNQPKTDVHCERYNTDKIPKKNIATSPRDNDEKKNNSTCVKTLNFNSTKKSENKNVNKLGFCETTQQMKKSTLSQNQQITNPCGKIIFLVLEEPSCKAGCCFRVYRQCTIHGTTVPANRYTLQCSPSVSVPKPIYPIKNNSNDCCLSQEARDENWSECFFISYDVHQNEDLNCNNDRSDTGTDCNSGKNNSS